MPPRRKAAATAASKKKGKKEEEAVEAPQESVDDESQKESAVDAGSAAPAPAVEAVEESKPTRSRKPAASKTQAAAGTRGQGRGRGKKAAAEQGDPEEADDQADGKLGDDNDAPSQMEVEEGSSAAQVMPETVEETPSAPSATAHTKEGESKVDVKATAAALSEVTSRASSVNTPDIDIAGVIAQREDEDVAMDETEPPPSDDEERRRLLERPTEARATLDMPAKFSALRNSAPDVNGSGNGSTYPPQASTSSNLFGESADPAPALSRDDRLAKMNELRKRMNDSAQANRREVVNAQNEHRKNIAESKRLERKRKQAEAMGEKLDALETGEDLERKRNWEYSLEDNEKWSKKQNRKERRADHGFANFDDSARRKYKRDIDQLKPDLSAYRTQKDAVAGFEGELVQSTSAGAVISADNQLFRDANSFVYADHRPSEDAIDRVIGQINQDIDKRAKRSRVRDEDDGDVTYINDRNKTFNKKLERYYNKFTEGTRNNLERGTAL